MVCAILRCLLLTNPDIPDRFIPTLYTGEEKVRHGSHWAVDSAFKFILLPASASGQAAAPHYKAQLYIYFLNHFVSFWPVVTAFKQ